MTSTTNESSNPSGAGVAPTRTDPLRVLCLDLSTGFGGATKSTALMLDRMQDVEPVILTSQEPDVIRRWYGKWRTYPFRRRFNYRTRWVLEDWMAKRGIRGIAHSIGLKAYALADAIVGVFAGLQIAIIAKRHRTEVLHLVTGLTPIEALVAGKVARIPTIAHLRGFFGTKKPHPLWPPVTLVIGDSAVVTESYVTTCGSQVPATTIHEVVDVEELQEAAGARDECRQELELSPDQIAVGLFGRIVQWKGQREFVVAMLSAMDKNPDLVGVLVGDPSDGGVAYYESVKTLITESGKQDRFRLTGYIEDVEPFYAAMDVVVHASTEPEPCGMVVMEAMAAQRPIIAADAGGPRELVRDGIDGYLVAPGDSMALARAVLELSTDPELRRRMGDSGHRRAEQLFDVPVAAARLRHIYGVLSSGDPDTLRD